MNVTIITTIKNPTTASAIGSFAISIFMRASSRLSCIANAVLRRHIGGAILDWGRPAMANNGTEKLIRAREALVAGLTAEIGDGRVLDAIARVPREAFVPEPFQHSAYENIPLPIGYGQTISQPLIVALMTQALLLTGNEKVLEIGTGSGYQTAILAQPRRPRCFSRKNRAAGGARAGGAAADGVYERRGARRRRRPGRPAAAPYDAIIVTAAAPEIPRELLDQLGPGGRLVIPVGGRDLQELVRIVKTPDGALRHNLGPCRFVPLLGKGAWPAQAPLS